MKDFDLSNDLNQSIVDGILKGYKEYLAVRKEAKEKLKVSAAYAWVKGNHIDSSVDELCSSTDNVESSIEKAGYTWEYIQFLMKEKDEKYLIIVKNGRGITKTFNGKTSKVNQDNYLYELAGINNPLVSTGKLKSINSDRAVQLELSLPEVFVIDKKVAMEAPEGYNRFYVVTYEFDEASMISRIALTLPNQQDMTLVEVSDLTPFIESSAFNISNEELEVVQNDKIPDSMYAEGNQIFGYGIAAENEEQDKKANQ